MLDKLFDKLTLGIERILALAFIVAVCLNFINVVGRYCFGWTLIWGDEVQIYIMIWMAFLGAVVASWRHMHLRMDILFKYFSLPVQFLVQLFELSVLSVLCGLMLFESGHYAEQMFVLDRVSDVAQIPMWIPNSGVALGFGLIALISLIRLVRLLRRGVAAQPADAPKETA
jgi:TRAP-type C4-dicarboxylate transport system permease small subunit